MVFLTWLSSCIFSLYDKSGFFFLFSLHFFLQGLYLLHSVSVYIFWKGFMTLLNYHILQLRNSGLVTSTLIKRKLK